MAGPLRRIPFNALIKIIEQKVEEKASSISKPPAGKFKVVNLYVQDEKLVIEYDDTPITDLPQP